MKFEDIDPDSINTPALKKKYEFVANLKKLLDDDLLIQILTYREVLNRIYDKWLHVLSMRAGGIPQYTLEEEIKIARFYMWVQFERSDLRKSKEMAGIDPSRFYSWCKKRNLPTL